MLHVRIDIIPFGDEDHRENIHDFYIANRGPEPGVNPETNDQRIYEWWDSDPRVLLRHPPGLGKVLHRRADGAMALASKVFQAYVKQKADALFYKNRQAIADEIAKCIVVRPEDEPGEEHA